jgi:hypothetical protein
MTMPRTEPKTTEEDGESSNLTAVGDGDGTAGAVEVVVVRHLVVLRENECQRWSEQWKREEREVPQSAK